MRYAYPFTLARRAVVVTMDLSAANLHLLESDHWLAKGTNVCVVRLTTSPWQDAALHMQSAEKQMDGWTAAEVVQFLTSHDLEGPAHTLFASGVRGQDLRRLTLNDLQQDLRLSAFATRRVLNARNAYLGV